MKSEAWGDVRNAPQLKTGTLWRKDSEAIWTLKSVYNKFGRMVYLKKGGVEIKVHLFDFYEQWHEVSIEEMMKELKG